MANKRQRPIDKLRAKRGLKSSSSSNSNTIENQISNYKKRLKNVGIDPEEVTDKRNPIEKLLNLEEDQNVLFDIFEILGRPQNALFSAIDEAASGGSFLEGAKQGFTGEKKVSGKDLLVDHLGMEDEEGKIDLADVLGFGADVFADPMNIVPVAGFGKFANALNDGAKLSDARRLLKTGDDIVAGAVGKAFKKGAKLGDSAITKAADVLDNKEWKRIGKLAAKEGFNNIDEYLEAKDLVGKIGTKSEGYANLKKGFQDIFNQKATKYGKLKQGQNAIEGQNLYLDELTKRKLDNLDNNAYNYVLRNADDLPANEVNSLNRYLSSTKDASVSKWIKENQDTRLAQELVKRSDSAFKDFLNVYENSMDTSLRGDKILRDLKPGQKIEASQESVEQIQKIFDDLNANSGANIKYSIDLSTPNRASITLDEISDLDYIKANPDVKNAFSNANLKYDLRYTDDELKYLDELKNNPEFMRFVDENKGIYNEINESIKDATGFDFGDILNNNYARRAKGDVGTLDETLKQIDDQLALTDLSDADRNTLQIARDAIQGRKDDLINPYAPTTSKGSFRGRKSNQPALVRNREYQEKVREAQGVLDRRNAQLDANLSTNQRTRLERELNELKNTKSQAEAIRDGVSEVELNKVKTSSEVKRVNKLKNKMNKLGIKNDTLDLKMTNAQKAQQSILESVNQDLIDKAFDISDTSIRKDLSKQMSEVATLNKRKEKILKQLDNVDNLDKKATQKLVRELEKVNDDIINNAAKLTTTKARITGSVTNKVKSEITKTTNSIKKFAKSNIDEAVSLAKKESNTELIRQASDEIDKIITGIDEEIKNIENIKLKSLDSPEFSTRDARINKQIETNSAIKSILETKESKELFDLNFRAGVADFLENAKLTNKDAKLYSDALGLGLFNDEDVFIPIDKATDAIKGNKAYTTLDGETLASGFNRIHTIIANETDDLFKRENIDAVMNSLKGKKFYVDKRMAHLFDKSVDITGTNATRGLLNMVDKVNTTFKKFSTLTPGFLVRNFLGNGTNMYLSGIPAKDLIPYSQKATKLLNSSDELFEKVSKGIKLTDVETKNLELLKQFYEGGFVNVGTAARDMERVLASVQTGRSKILNKGTEFVNYVNNATDGMQRMATLMYANENPNYLRRLGVDNPIEAVKYALMDPSAMSETERDVLKKIVPFYTFTKQNLMFQASNMGKNLGRYRNLIKGINDMYKDLPEDSYQAYQKNNMQIPLPISDDEGNQMFLKANLPLSDLGEMLSDPTRRIVSSVTPLIKTPFEMSSGINTFTGQPNYYKTGEQFANALGIQLSPGVSDAAGVAEQVLNGLGLQNVSTNLIRKVTSIIEGVNGEKTPQQVWAEILKSVTQNVNQENVRNSGLYEDLAAYQAYVNQLKNQGQDVPTITEINKANRIKLNNLKKKRASR